MHPAIFLDRDNTIIHNDGDLGDPDQVKLIQGAASAIASLCGLGYKIVVITNQGGVARGKYTEADVDRVHQRISELLSAAANGAHIERYYACPYHPEGNLKQYRKEHPNRKPNPGMILEAAEDLKLDLSQSWTIGDQLRDVQAGKAAGTRTILIAPGGYEPDERTPGAQPDFIARNMIEAVRVVASQRKPEAVEEAERAEKGGKRWDAAAIARIQKAAPRKPPQRQEEEQAAEDEPRSSKPAAPPRPSMSFRPWDAPPEREEPPLIVRRAMRRRPREPEQAEPQTPPAAPEPVAVAPPEPIHVPPPAPVQAEPVAPEESPDEPTPSVERSLRMILQELRHMRGSQGEFNAISIFAMVLQGVAIICLGGALLMPGQGELQLLFSWLGAGLMVQLGVIATLLFSRMR